MQATNLLPKQNETGRKNLPGNMQGWVKTGLLFGLAAYFIYVIASGNVANYINARFVWLSYVAVALFLVLAVSSAVDLLRGRNRRTDELQRTFQNNLLGVPKTLQTATAVTTPGVSWRVLAIVAIPLVLGTLIPSRPLGSAAVDGNISLSAVSAAGAATFSTDPLTWNVLDWLRSFNQSDDINSFNGKQADVVGFVYREATFPDDQFMLARFTISCCVADAGAIGVPVVWDTAANYPADTWLRVQGSWEVGEFRGDTVPILRPVNIEQVPQPEHPYLYP